MITVITLVIIATVSSARIFVENTENIWHVSKFILKFGERAFFKKLGVYLLLWHYTGTSEFFFIF